MELFGLLMFNFLNSLYNLSISPLSDVELVKIVYLFSMLVKQICVEYAVIVMCIRDTETIGSYAIYQHHVRFVLYPACQDCLSQACEKIQQVRALDAKFDSLISHTHPDPHSRKKDNSQKPGTRR